MHQYDFSLYPPGNSDSIASRAAKKAKTAHKFAPSVAVKIVGIFTIDSIATRAHSIASSSGHDDRFLRPSYAIRPTPTADRCRPA